MYHTILVFINLLDATYAKHPKRTHMRHSNLDQTIFFISKNYYLQPFSYQLMGFWGFGVLGFEGVRHLKNAT